MAGRTTFNRNNIIAGLFVIFAMLLAIAVSVAVSGATKRLTPTTPYTIQFTLADGASGLKAGSPVTLGGQEVGRVLRTRFSPDTTHATAVDVDVVINSNVTLHTDAWAFLEKPLLGTMSAINVPYVGGDVDPAKPQSTPAPVLQANAVLKGTVAPPGFLAQAGYGPEQSKQLQQILERFDRLSARLDEKIAPGIQTVVDDAAAVVSDIRKRAPEWEGKVDSVLTKADDFAGQLKPLTDNANQTVTDARKLVSDFQAALDANRPEIDSIIQNIDQAAKKVNEHSIALLDDALTGAKTGADAFAQSGRDLNALIDEQTPNIRRIMGNLRLAADQVKLAGIEIRRNPWRILYQPKTKELEAELFYDAARTYAEAVSDLRSASEALEILTASAGPDAVAVNRESLSHIAQRINEAFKRYETAEQELLKKMTEQQK
jgi:ABC-type transporter Mla subunit MlaD